MPLGMSFLRLKGAHCPLEFVKFVRIGMLGNFIHKRTPRACASRAFRGVGNPPRFAWVIPHGFVGNPPRLRG